MTPQQLLNQSEAALKACACRSPEPELEETFRQIWRTIRSGRFYAGQPRNAATSKCVALARNDHSQAVEAFEKAGDRQSSTQGYLNLANALASIDRFDEADCMYERVERTSLELGLTDLWSQATYNRSYLWFLRGRYSEALRSFEELRRRFEQTGSVRHSSLCDLDTAEIYLQLNLSQDAIALATRAADQFQQINMHYERAKGTRTGPRCCTFIEQRCCCHLDAARKH